MANEESVDSDHTYRPDIFTSSDQYAGRFSGPVGDYFLRIQSELTSGLLRKSSGTLDVLDVGGGHGQLTELLLLAGHHIHIQGSDQKCFKRFVSLSERYPRQISFIEVPLERFEPSPMSYDVVLAFRLLAHVRDWRGFLDRIAVGARGQLVLDIASLSSFSILTPMLFPIKKMIEGNTREYYCHSPEAVTAYLVKLGFPRVRLAKEFFLPMGLHRAVGSVKFSETSEGLASKCGLTTLFGSPCIVSAER